MRVLVAADDDNCNCTLGSLNYEELCNILHQAFGVEGDVSVHVFRTDHPRMSSWKPQGSVSTMITIHVWEDQWNGYPDAWVEAFVRSHLEDFDQLILVSADRDFLPLVQDLLTHGKRVIVMPPGPSSWPANVEKIPLRRFLPRYPNLLHEIKAASSGIGNKPPSTKSSA